MPLFNQRLGILERESQRDVCIGGRLRMWREQPFRDPRMHELAMELVQAMDSGAPPDQIERVRQRIVERAIELEALRLEQ
jgi:hypothetical protein